MLLMYIIIYLVFQNFPMQKLITLEVKIVIYIHHLKLDYSLALLEINLINFLHTNLLGPSLMRNLITN